MLVDGYEDGYDPISSVSQLSLVRQKSFEWYNGEFDDAKTGAPDVNQAVVLKRPHRTEGVKN